LQPIPAFAPPAPVAPAATPSVAAVTPADRWLLMQTLQGTWPGWLLDDNRLRLSGWLDMSYTISSAAHSNEPMVWNDRANEFLLQQAWLRFERPVVTAGTTEPTVGFRSDWLVGSDYRFTMARGLWNSQLLNSTGAQNLYGADPVQFYANAYFPTLFQGTEVRVGRHFCPFGTESNEAISTPLLSRSYGFNNSPFTHTGLMVLSTLTPEWTVNLMLINGNDVFLDKSEELRMLGKLIWTSPDKRDIVALSTSAGRGKFNAGDPFNPATVGTQSEPAGRNNYNVFDATWTHTFNAVVSATVELTYAYEDGVPANVPGGIIQPGATTAGTAHWGSLVNYLNYTLSPRLTGVTRLEFFDDFEGQRTGFPGLYSAVTTGVQWKIRKDVILRPEVRFDYNGESKPFEGKHGLFTASSDLILRW
jgi:hypothetical protein